MSIVINGSGTVTGISAGGLPDGSVDNDTVASGITSSKLTGALPAISGANLTGMADLTAIENNIAMLGFYRATDHSKAKYNLVDQVIDDYNDATGIDASASTNESLVSGKYQGYTTGGTITTAFSYTGSNQTWTAPTGVTSATVKLWGAGGSGGSRYTGSISGRAGGGAGYIGATVAVVAGTAYSLLIGESAISVNGVSASPHTNSYGGGANGGGRSDQRLGGSGGGRSEFSIGGGANVPAGTRILVAGGGGGGAAVYSATDDGDENSSDGGGGAGGGTTGGTGRGSGTPPTGGTQSAGGARGVYLSGGSGATSVDGAAGLGGGAQGSNTAVDTNYGAGGGGGGGYYGGGGGSSSAANAMAHGGGGGSSYANGSLTSSVTNTQGSYGPIGSTGGAVANAGDANYPGGSVGVGGDGVLAQASTNTEGGHGAGVVIYDSNVAGGNLTLQSTASTASTAPTTGDIVMLIENASGTATLNTDIKAYVSRNGGSTFTQGTLIEEGTWGTNKKILAFHDLDISGQSSGTDIRYKITTHNQSPGSKVTNIHATSLAWA